MTITYPLDLLSSWPGWSTEFELFYRQEQSRQANGRTLVKDFGSPLWRASYLTRTLSANQLDQWRARLDALENGLQTFRGYPLSRCRPQAHPGSAGLPIGELHTIDGNRKSIRVDDLDGITLSVGDMIQIGTRNLHRVMEPATGTLTALFEVRPHLWPETEVEDEVIIGRPSCIMTVVPGSVSSTADLATGRGSVSFQAIEAR